MTIPKSALKALIGLAFLAAGVAIVAGSAAYVVDESEQVIILQFGAPVGDVVADPGLHFKKPFVQQVRRFDKRLLAWDGYPNEIPTLGREFIYVDTTARWRIVNALLFLESVRDELGAQSRLDDIIDSAVRDEISSMELVEIVRSDDWAISRDDMEDQRSQTSQEDLDRLTREITVGREGIVKNILDRASVETRTIGIELVDVRIKRLNYVSSVRNKVYDRMISERERIAAEFRSEGEGRSAEIKGETEKELQGIQSDAARQAEIIKGQADAEAIRIYAEAFNAAPDFYDFLRTIESYTETMGPRTTLLLGADSEYFTYLKEIGEPVLDERTLDIEARLKRIEEISPPAGEVVMDDAEPTAEMP